MQSHGASAKRCRITQSFATAEFSRAVVSTIKHQNLQYDMLPVLGGGAPCKSWREAFAVLSIGEAACGIVKPELRQALSQASLQGVLFWHLRLPLLHLLGVDPPQRCPPCLDVLHAHLAVEGQPGAHNTAMAQRVKDSGLERERETLHLFQPPRADQMPDPIRARVSTNLPTRHYTSAVS